MCDVGKLESELTISCSQPAEIHVEPGGCEEDANSYHDTIDGHGSCLHRRWVDKIAGCTSRWRASWYLTQVNIGRHIEY